MRSFHFPGRSAVYGRRAMCATSHPAASLTAIEILRQGGNAVDAAIATAARAGGGGVSDDRHRRRLFRRSSPSRARRCRSRSMPRDVRRRPRRADWYANKGIGRIETSSVHAVTVPGAVDGWCRCVKITAACRWRRLLEPAIALAEQGFAVAPRVSRRLGARRRASWPDMPARPAHFLPTGRAASGSAR